MGDSDNVRAPQLHESAFWRRLAHWGATKGPEWWVRYSPPVFGWAAAALVPSARRAVLENLRRIRGPQPIVRDAKDVLTTFGTYASCLAEVLSNDADEGPRMPSALVFGELNMKRALVGRGIVIVTAHTAGWEAVGPLLSRDWGLDLMIVMQEEPDAAARALHDHARERVGLKIAHIGDPLSALPLARHLRSNGAVALQLDRFARGMKTRQVPMLDGLGEIPEGPLKLAQATGAPVVPVFCARTGYRRYEIHIEEPVFLDRTASEAELRAAAEHVGRSMTRFLRAHPTQWFDFHGRS